MSLYVGQIPRQNVEINDHFYAFNFLLGYENLKQILISLYTCIVEGAIYKWNIVFSNSKVVYPNWNSITASDVESATQ